jgi:hypothetical protein
MIACIPLILLFIFFQRKISFITAYYRSRELKFMSIQLSRHQCGNFPSTLSGSYELAISILPEIMD